MDKVKKNSNQYNQNSIKEEEEKDSIKYNIKIINSIILEKKYTKYFFE